MDKKEIYNRWKPIMDSYGLTGSKADWMSEYIQFQKMEGRDRKIDYLLKNPKGSRKLYSWNKPIDLSDRTNWTIMSKSKSTKEAPETNLLPIAMKVAAKTLSLDHLGFATKEEINQVKNRVFSENRDRKINSIVDGVEFTEKKLEDDPEYIKLSKKGVVPMPAPIGVLAYLDFKHDVDKLKGSGDI